MAMLGDQHEAEEVGQLTFIRFYRSMAKFRGRSSLQTYLVRICINLCLDRLKQRKRRREREFPLEAAEGTGLSPQAGEGLEARQFVERALEQLDEKHRAVVVLRMIHGYSTKETAKLLNLPQGTVLSRLKRGMDYIRNDWSDEYKRN